MSTLGRLNLGTILAGALGAILAAAVLGFLNWLTKPRVDVEWYYLSKVSFGLQSFLLSQDVFSDSDRHLSGEIAPFEQAKIVSVVFSNSGRAPSAPVSVYTSVETDLLEQSPSHLEVGQRIAGRQKVFEIPSIAPNSAVSLSLGSRINPSVDLVISEGQDISRASYREFAAGKHRPSALSIFATAIAMSATLALVVFTALLAKNRIDVQRNRDN